MVYVIQVTVTACEQDQDGNAVPSWSCWQAVSKTCMTYTIAVCTVKNSWWWTEELSETCKFFMKKFNKLVRLVGFIIRMLISCLLTTGTRYLANVHWASKWLRSTQHTAFGTLRVTGVLNRDVSRRTCHVVSVSVLQTPDASRASVSGFCTNGLGVTPLGHKTSDVINRWRYGICVCSRLHLTVAQWLRCCTTNWKVAGSIPYGVIGIFHWHNPSDRTMALGSTQPLTEISTRTISLG